MVIKIIEIIKCSNIDPRLPGRILILIMITLFASLIRGRGGGGGAEGAWYEKQGALPFSAKAPAPPGSRSKNNYGRENDLVGRRGETKERELGIEVELHEQGGSVAEWLERRI